MDYLREENRVLREQLGSGRLRFTDDQRRRLAAKAKLVGRRGLAHVAGIATPDTLLAWHRKLIAEKYDGSAKRGPGRPRIVGELEELVVRMAQENRNWGYRRILGAMSNLGHKLARGTIANILRKHGIEPAPERIRKTTWKEFLSQHWELIMAADFFTVEVWTGRGLVTHYLLFVISLADRVVKVAGITTRPDEAWMLQKARNLTDCAGGALQGKQYLIIDRDTKYSEQFRRMIRDNGTKVIRLPPMSPNLNLISDIPQPAHLVSQ